MARLNLSQPAFWTRPQALAAIFLRPFSAIYGLLAARNLRRKGRQFPIPVLCIGNYVSGGQGKTPMAITLAHMAQQQGLKPVFLTRGFGGKFTGPLLVDRASMSATDVGDEPLLLVDVAPVILSRRREAAAESDLLTGFDLVIMDDGFQSSRVLADANLIIVDGGMGLGNGLVLPAGPLRAPLGPQLAKTNLLVVIRDAERGIASIAPFLTKFDHLPVIFGSLKPVEPLPPKGHPFVAYAGIGRPEKFFASLRAAGYRLAGTHGFGDHHVFSENEASQLLQEAEEAGALLVTTAKDKARLAGASGAAGRLHACSQVFHVGLALENEAPILALLAAISGHKSQEARFSASSDAAAST